MKLGVGLGGERNQTRSSTHWYMSKPVNRFIKLIYFSVYNEILIIVKDCFSYSDNTSERVSFWTLRPPVIKTL